MQTKCLMAAIVGPTNVGKSTLFNRIMGSEISIVTHKVQTTRFPIKGGKLVGNSQLILVDSPGLFTAKSPLEMVIERNTQTVLSQEWDSVLLVVDASKGITSNILRIIPSLAGSKLVLIINKVDLVPKDTLLELAKSLADITPFERLFMISALKNDGLEALTNYLATTAQDSPWLYPEDYESDAPMDFRIAEITRKQLFLNLHQEVPYSVVVQTEAMEQTAKDCWEIFQVIYVTKESQKAIILGENGRSIKNIRLRAEAAVKTVLGQRVILKLFVKVRKDWIQDHFVRQHIGYK